MEWSIQQIAKTRRHHQPHAAALRRHRPAAAVEHRPQRLPPLRRRGARAAAADPAAARPRPRAAADRARCSTARRPRSTPSRATSRGCVRSRTGWHGRSCRSNRPSTTLRGGERLMAENMFDGFDHTQYKDEVEQRWGKKAYADSDRWWRGMDADEKAAWKSARRDARPGLDRGGRAGHRARQRRGAGARAAARRVADRHPRHAGGNAGRGSQGIPARSRRDVRRRPALRANYGGQDGAEFVRDALRAYADANL